MKTKEPIHLTLAFLLIFTFSAFAESQYATKLNVPYYEGTTNQDTYQNSRCLLDIYYPTNATNFATIVWFHGGGITGGSKELPRELMNQGLAVIGVQYRLSPQAKAPSYIEDTAAAVAWTFHHISEYGGSTNLIFLSGHSAGGYLTMMVTLDKSYLSKHQVDANDIAGLIPFSGQAITHFTIREERGIKNTQAIIDEYAPIYHVRANTPPITLITGDREMELLGRYEENAYLLRMLKLIGNQHVKLYELQGFDHGGMAAPAFPLLLKEVSTLTKQKTSSK